jgi:hypothetical protein
MEPVNEINIASNIPVKSKSINPLLFIFAGITILSISIAIYFFVQSRRDSTKDEISQAEQVKDIVSKVGKLIELPTGEEPTLATVADPSKLRDQPFFAKAKTGDKVLVYSIAKKVILYDPVANKVIDIAPLNNK